MKKSSLFLGAFLLGIASVQAQNLGFSQAAENFWAEVRATAPVIFAIIFLVSALINSGKLYGESRDYVAFFRGLGIWAGSLTAIGAIVTYILSMRFG